MIHSRDDNQSCLVYQNEILYNYSLSFSPFLAPPNWDQPHLQSHFWARNINFGARIFVSSVQITKACFLITWRGKLFRPTEGLKSLLEHVACNYKLFSQRDQISEIISKSGDSTKFTLTKSSKWGKVKVIALKRVRINLSIFLRTFSRSLHFIFWGGKNDDGEV